MALGEDFVKAIKHKTDEKASQVKQVKKDINAIMGVKKVDASLKKTKYSTLLASLKALKTFVEEHTSGDELLNPLKEIKKIFAGGYSEKIAKHIVKYTDLDSSKESVLQKNFDSCFGD